LGLQHIEGKAGIGVTQSQARECLGPPEAERDKEKILSYKESITLISDFCPP
jgi:hypothetical protein